ncbi:MAG: apolipoprotein N-acyltransferase [Nocardioidaceae bacterium]
MPAPARLILLGRAMAAATSGLLMALAFPPVDWVWTMPLGLAGLMWAVQEVSGRAGFGLGLLFGLGFMLPLMRWITIIGPDAWIALGLLEATFYALTAMTWAWLRGRPWWPATLAATWVAGEWLRGEVPFGGLPWGRLAFGLLDTPVVRYGRLGGTALVSFVVVLVVALTFDVVQRHADTWRTAGQVFCALGLLGLSLVVPVGAAGAAGQIQVAAVQGNVPGEGMDAFAERRAVLHNHAEAATDFGAQVDRGAEPAPDIMIWPENSTDIDPYADHSVYEEIDRAVRAVGVPTLVGAVAAGPDSTHVQNMGIVWSPRTGPGQQYVKRHPVPFGEYIPFRSLLTKFIDRLNQIPKDFAQGDHVGVLDLGTTRIGDVICFEVAYDDLVRDVVDDGAELLVVQTNNATYTGTGQLEQQFAISRYRAIETGRSVVVAATNGISGVITPDGTVTAVTQTKTRAVLDEPAELATGITLGVRFGALVEGVLCAMAALATAWGYLGRRRSVGRMSR